MKLLGHIDSVSRNGISGWITNERAPHEELKIGIVLNGKVIFRLIANQFREDLAGAFPGATGRHGFRFNFTPPLSSFDDHEVSVVVANDVVPSRHWVRSLPSIHQATLPLLVTSAGRSGSTLIMNQLNAHPDIVLVADYPAEVKQLSYYAMALRVLTAQADRENSTDPDSMLDQQFSIGFNPFCDPSYVKHPHMEAFWSRTSPMMLARTFRDLILIYYETVRAISGKPVMRFLAEKAQPDPVIRQAVLMMFGAVREIVLLRDPRDLVCSYNAFWDTDLPMARQTVVSQLRPIMALFEERLPSTLFIKYEYLASQPREAMRDAFSFLGLSHAPLAPNDQSVFERHGTSRSPEASIGRWRRDLPKAEIEACDHDFEAFLSAFGYEEE